MLERTFVANAMSAAISERQELMKGAEADFVGGSVQFANFRNAYVTTGFRILKSSEFHSV